MRKRLKLDGKSLGEPKDKELMSFIEDKARELCEYVVRERGKDIEYFDLECLVMRSVYGAFVSTVLKDAYEELKNNAKNS